MSYELLLLFFLMGAFILLVEMVKIIRFQLVIENSLLEYLNF